MGRSDCGASAGVEPQAPRQLESEPQPPRQLESKGGGCGSLYCGPINNPYDGPYSQSLIWQVSHAVDSETVLLMPAYVYTNCVTPSGWLHACPQHIEPPHERAQHDENWNATRCVSGNALSIA